MTDYLDNLSSATSATGDTPSERTVIRAYNFDRYTIEIELTETGKFVGIVSIKVQKSFVKSLEGVASLDFHDVEKYYRDE